jgi:acyl carrier protein
VLPKPRTPPPEEVNVTKEEIFEQVKTSLVEMFDLPEERIVPSATLREDLDLDSIDAVDMAVHLQKMTGKRVELAKLKEIRTVGDVVGLVQAHLEGGPDAEAKPSADSVTGSGVEASPDSLTEARSQAEAS